MKCKVEMKQENKSMEQTPSPSSPVQMEKTFLPEPAGSN
jgi:hypothetical protein